MDMQNVFQAVKDRAPRCRLGHAKVYDWIVQADYRRAWICRHCFEEGTDDLAPPSDEYGRLKDEKHSRGEAQRADERAKCAAFARE